MHDYERAVIKGFLESLEESGIVLTFFENVDDEKVILDSNKLLDDYLGE